MEYAQRLSTPSVKNAFLEVRVALDVLGLPLRMARLGIGRCENVGEGRPVFVLPGFGAGDLTMAPFRFFLNKHGFDAMPWGLGVNRAGLDLNYDLDELTWDMELPAESNGETGVPRLCDLMSGQVREFYNRTGCRVSLVGWSLGGYIAREVARECPEMVEQVITLGSPIIGGPKYTAAAPVLAKQGLDLDWIEQGVAERENIDIRCPVSAIVSPTDGVVDWSASYVPDDDATRFIKINISHLGMGFSQRTMKLVLKELAKHRV